MGAYPDKPSRTPVATGKTRLCIASWPMTTHGGRAVHLARLIQQKEPEAYETWFYFTFGENFRGPNGDGQGGIVGDMKKLFTPEAQERLQKHKTTPFVWLEQGGGVVKGLGGRDNFSEWILQQPDLVKHEDIKALASTGPSISDAWFDNSPGSVQAPLERAC